MHRLAQLSEDRDDRIGFVQDHAVVEIVINPARHLLFDVGKIDDHPAMIELRSFEHNHSFAVVPVQMLALAIVVQQPMAVTKVNFSGHSKHEQPFF